VQRAARINGFGVVHEAKLPLRRASPPTLQVECVQRGLADDSSSGVVLSRAKFPRSSHTTSGVVFVRSHQLRAVRAGVPRIHVVE
jgi:hypothetical protein